MKTSMCTKGLLKVNQPS